MSNQNCISTFLLFTLLNVSAVAQEISAPSLRSAEIGNVKNVHAFGATLLAGQPTPEDLHLLAKDGIKTVISMRQKDETDWDEAALLSELGVEFHRFGFQSPETLTDKIFDQTLALLKDKQGQPLLLHCASANRIGAIWLAHRVVNDGLAVEAAQAEAKTVGLRTPGYEQKALDYLKVRQSRGDISVKPGINKTFLDPELDVAEWLGKFEIESREVYAARERVLDAMQLQPGQTVADIGAGTGFYSRLFANEVGEQGWVFAVDISLPFLKHINKQAEADKVANITTVLGTAHSIRLPPNSVDTVFICDTYHHFEYPSATLASIHKALKPGGTLNVIDFERIPGKSREWTIDHVRAGKEEFKKEITDAGYELIEEVNIPSFQENYFLRFKK